MEIYPIGTIHTGFSTLDDCPPTPGLKDGTARIEVFAPFRDGLYNFSAEEVDVLYWFDKAPRDRLRSATPHDGVERGVFAMRSPHRPNPIALSRVRVIKADDTGLTVDALDCLDGTSLIDLKPVRINRNTVGKK
ncbi:SAM-dependent methyltransferase [Martelella mangrovi]|uniref:tRNA-Thr(GGU) m(6)t(6)A37 methyltransferase TsaA n=1 Tax=Martelella mangrovi TaxID=1397477 RepID=A0ABV2IA71_9HYPH